MFFFPIMISLFTELFLGSFIYLTGWIQAICMFFLSTLFLSRALVGKSIVKSIIFKNKETNVNNKISHSFKKVGRKIKLNTFHKTMWKILTRGEFLKNFLAHCLTKISEAR